jgi:hypothetical protein
MYAAAFFFLAVCFIITPSMHTNDTTIKSNIAQRVKEIPLPDGYERLFLPNNSFGYFLREQSLKSDRTVYLFNGKLKHNQTAQYAVLTISTGKKDLQQCADAVMRLRAEFLKQQQKPICFADNAGKKYCWDQYKQRGWQGYLETVFGMCGTISLEKELKPKEWANVTAGDVLIKGGSPGHAVIVMDVARHKISGGLIFLLVQSYMPAQNIHVLQNFNDKDISPWYRVPSGKTLLTPEWTFYASQLRSWR